MNRKKRKSIYINIKNSWKKYLNDNKIIELTLCIKNTFSRHNPKHPFNQIIMDFKNRDDIVKYGVIRGRWFR